jgi:protoporphyrinogen oxidase
MGIFFDRQINKFSTPLDLLKFKPFNFFEKIKFGLSIIYLQKLENWNKLENITAKDWLTKWVGNKVYNVMWKPLLKIKFGKKTDKISAAWLWGRINPRSKSRSGGMFKEKLGYLDGGFKKIIDELERKIIKNGGKIIKNKSIEKIKLNINEIDHIICSKKKYKFDLIISTVSIPTLLKLTELLKESYVKELRKIEYQSVVCMTLILKKSLSDIYWLNICDPKIPFGGIIEHTNFIQKEKYGGHTIVYLFNYIPKNHKFYSIKDKELFKTYLKGLKKVFPEFSEKWIKNYVIYRDEFATPIYTKNYSHTVPKHKTPIKNLYIANTSQIYPFDRNINNSVKIAKKVSDLVLHENN